MENLEDQNGEHNKDYPPVELIEKDPTTEIQ